MKTIQENYVEYYAEKGGEDKLKDEFAQLMS
jgi:hypothetical protein